MIWSEDDWNMQDDLAELALRLRSLDCFDNVADDVLHARLSVHHAAGLPQAQPGQHLATADGCCCQSHCTLSHNGAGVLRDFQGLLNISNMACDMDPKIPCFKAMLVENMYEAPTSAGAEPDLDNLSDFLLNFNQA